MRTKTLITEYIPTNRDGQFLKCELYYSLGGVNYFSYKNEPRGYYVSVSPVERSTRSGVTMESYAAFSGVKNLVVQCERQSAKNEQRATELYESARDEVINLPRFNEYRAKPVMMEG